MGNIETLTKGGRNEDVQALIEQQHRMLIWKGLQPQDAEDITQEAMIKYEALPPEPKIFKRGYLNTMTFRLGIGHYRKKRREQQHQEEQKEILRQQERKQETLEEIQEEQEQKEILRKTIEQINPNLRLTARLHYISGWDTERISQGLGIAQSTVRKRLYRAKIIIKRKIQNLYDH